MGGRKEQELPPRRSGREACFFLICFACICICILLIIQHRHPPFHPTTAMASLAATDRTAMQADVITRTDGRGARKQCGFPMREEERRGKNHGNGGRLGVYYILLLPSTCTFWNGRQTAGRQQAGGHYDDKQQNKNRTYLT